MAAPSSTSSPTSSLGSPGASPGGQTTELDKDQLANQLRVFVQQLQCRHDNVKGIQKHLPDNPNLQDVHRQLVAREESLSSALADCRKARQHVCLTA